MKKYEQVRIHTDFITLGKLLKFQGIISSGSDAKTYVYENKIMVDGEVCTQRGKKLYPSTKIEINDTEFFEILDDSKKD